MRIFSGIQPTGVPHLGNYIGALKQWKHLAADGSSSLPFFCIVDLHAVTSTGSRNSRTSLRNSVLETAAVLHAIMHQKSDDESSSLSSKANIFVQSAVPYHTELAWYFASCAQFGELQRMTQWKAKSLEGNGGAHGSSCALFTYPILQAADIALYRGEQVPVGVDQLQHLELSRTVIGRFNKRFGMDLPLPQPILGKCVKVMSLRDPRVKMSKSDGSLSATVAITDDPDTIRKNFRKAVTDSHEGITFDPQHRPGISNLLSIMAAMDDVEQEPEEMARRYRNCTASQLKNECAQLVTEHLRPIREQYNLLMMNEEGRREVEARLQRDNEVARETGGRNMAAIRDRVMNHRRSDEPIQ